MVSLACIFDAHEVCGLDICGCSCHKGEVDMTLEEILEHLAENGEETLLMKPRSEYDECIIGVGARFHDGPLAIYSVERILEVLMRDGDEEGAMEHFEYNIIGGWSGPGTPIFVYEREMRG
jgi:hypothetical protein